MALDMKEFYDIVDQIDNNVYYYWKNKIARRNTYIVLANGKSFNFKIPESSVAHLLGVDPVELKEVAQSCRVNFIIDEDEAKASYPLLRALIKSRDSVYYSMYPMGGKKPKISYDKLFSEYLDRKLAGFISNLDINASTIDWVCRYSKVKATGFMGTASPFDYIIKRSNEKGEIFLLGLRTASNGNGYICPVSNQYFSSEDDLNYRIVEAKLLAGQTISFSTFSSDNFNHRIVLDAETKEKKHKGLELVVERVEKTLYDTFGVQDDCAVPEIVEGSDYGWSQGKAVSSKSTGHVSNRYAYPISMCMSQGKKITPQDLKISSFGEVDSSLMMIINGYNTAISATGLSEEDRAKYIALLGQVDELEKSLSDSRQQCQGLQAAYDSLLERNEDLTSKVGTYQKTLGTIYEAVVATGIKK